MKKEEELMLIVDDKYLSHVQGKVLTLLEALGHNVGSSQMISTTGTVSNQSSAIRSLVNDAIWGDMHNGWSKGITQQEWDDIT